MKKIIFVLVLIFILGLVSVSAEDINESDDLNEGVGLSASVGSGRMVLYPILNPGKSTMMEKSLSITNHNKFSVNVSLEGWRDIKDIIEFKEPIFPLGPFESKNAEFILNVSEMKLHEGEIRIKFLRGSFDVEPEEGVAQGLGIISKVVISPQFNESVSTDIKDYTGEKDYNWLWFIGIGLIILIVVIISWGVIKNAEGKP